MLTLEMIRIISLLKRISNAPSLGIQENGFFTPEDRILLDRLSLAGLVHVKTGVGKAISYELTKPFGQISLCDVLRVTGGEVRLSFDDEKEIYDRYGTVGRRLGVTNYMVCRFLSEISLAEILLPDESILQNKV